MILLDEYLMGRDKQFPLTEEQKNNATDLLCRVNYLLGLLQRDAKVSSGYRPAGINAKVGGAVNSTHSLCMGVDLMDIDRVLANTLMADLSILEICGLYLENPEFTKTWVHLDTRKRINRVFNP